MIGIEAIPKLFPRSPKSGERIAGKPMRTVGHSQNNRDKEREARIIAMREAGLLNSDIARDLGITRERVRQIVKRSGRTDLLGYSFQAARKREQAAPDEIRTCVICGRQFAARPHKATMACSVKCGGRRRAKTTTAEEIAFVERVLCARRAGEKWLAIAMREGFKVTSHPATVGHLCSQLSRRAARNGIDITDIFRRRA